MKRILYRLLLLLLLAGSACTSPKPSLFSETTISSAGAREDFALFTEILERAHPGLHSYLPEEAYRHLCDSIIKQLKGRVTIRQFYTLLSVLSSRIHCGHTGVDFNDEAYTRLNDTAVFFPLPVMLASDGLVCNFDNNRIPAGSLIISINNRPVQALLKDMRIYNEADAPGNNSLESLSAESFGFQYFLAYGPAPDFNIRYLPPDSGATEKEGIFNAVTLTELNRRNSYERFYTDPTDIDYDFEYSDDDGFALLTCRTFDFFSSSRIRAFENFCRNSFKLLKLNQRIRHLIIDVRQNTGGNLASCHYLFSHLYNKPYRQHDSAWTITRKLPQQHLLTPETKEDLEELNSMLEQDFESKPGRRYMELDSVNELVLPASNVFNGRVYVITSARTASSAAYFAALVQNSGRGMVIGEETSGGPVMQNGFRQVAYELPVSKITFHFSVAHVKHSFAQNSSLNHGVVPRYYRPSSSKDVTANTDNQVNFIIDSLINK